MDVILGLLKKHKGKLIALLFVGVSMLAGKIVGVDGDAIKDLVCEGKELPAQPEEPKPKPEDPPTEEE